MFLSFTTTGWDQYAQWEIDDRKLSKKINELIKEIKRDPFSGVGKPEPLKYDLKGCWSRRIDKEHRLVYQVDDEHIYILSCKYHYGD
jgi:toxin YoeB